MAVDIQNRSLCFLRLLNSSDTLVNTFSSNANWNKRINYNCESMQLSYTKHISLVSFKFVYILSIIMTVILIKIDCYNILISRG